MPRLTNRGATNRAPASAASFPPFPNLGAEIAELDGGRTNAAFQRWNAQMRARLEGNSMQDNGRFRDIQTTVTRQDGYLESVWTMQAITGPVVTGMTLFSSIDPTLNTTVSRITFQADTFQIQSASGNNKQIFATTLDEIKLGDVLTVDLANAKVYIGTGTYNNNNTAFYVDDGGFFSLKSYLSFNPDTNTLSIATSAGSAGGWTINATTLTGGNATLDSAGVLTLGTVNDIIYISAVDATYRIWVGNVTAGSAAFRVTKAGTMTAVNGVFSGTVTATSGAIGGWTIGATTLTGGGATLSSAGTLTLGTVNDVVVVTAADATYRLWVGNATAASATFRVTKAGVLTATGATITGSITATTGEIGGWTISSTTLAKNNATLDSAGQLILGTTNDVVYLSATDATYRIWVGNVTAASATFRVTKAGVLTATGATITGSITATSGTIGGWTLASTTLSANNATLDSAGQLILGTANDVVYLSATDATYRIWIGNVTAGSASFRVTKAGALTATGGTFSGSITATTGAIAGFTITATELSSGAGADALNLFSSGTGIVVGNNAGAGLRTRIFNVSGSGLSGIDIRNTSNTTVLLAECASSAGLLNVNDSGGINKIQLSGSTGAITISGTTVIDASRNVTGASLDSTGAITINSTTVIDASRHIYPVLIRGESGGYTVPMRDGTEDISFKWDAALQLFTAKVTATPVKLVRAGTYTATPISNTGFVTMKDDGGTDRQFMIGA